MVPTLFIAVQKTTVRECSYLLRILTRNEPWKTILLSRGAKEYRVSFMDIPLTLKKVASLL